MESLVTPSVQVIDDKLMVSSLNIAKVFGKKHKNVLRGIEQEIEKGKINRLNFEPIEYKDGKARPQQAYLLDERFTTKLIMNFTGSKADDYQLSFIDEFIRMRELLNNDERYLKLQEENKSLRLLLKQESEKYTQAKIESAEVIEKRKARSPYYEAYIEYDLFGFPQTRYRLKAKADLSIFKMGHCIQTLVSCRRAGIKHRHDAIAEGIFVELDDNLKV
jgi:Rha family phage regulatory protein